MGRMELDPDDPNYPDMLAAIHGRALKCGSNVVELAFDGVPCLQVFVGTNHRAERKGADPAGKLV